MLSAYALTSLGYCTWCLDVLLPITTLMRCINMKIKGIILLLIDFIVLSLSFNEQRTGSKKSLLDEGVTIPFDECPVLLKIVQNNNIANYTINCKPVALAKSKKISEESVLQFACFVVSNMLLYICKKGINIKREDLGLEEVNKTSICPINFISLMQHRYIEFQDFEKVLANEIQCKQVCYDIDEPKNQCVILNKVNEILKRSSQSEVAINKAAQGIPETSYTESKIPGNNLVKTETRTEENNKNITENETKISEIKKEEVMIETTKVEENTKQQANQEMDTKIVEENQNDKKMPESLQEKKINNTFQEQPKSTSSVAFDLPQNEPNLQNPEIDESKPINDDIEGDEDMETLGLRPNTNQVADIKRLDNFEGENIISAANKPSFAQSSNKNEIYSGEGFFDAEESHFFFYFLMFSSVIVIGYLAFHNKNKILAYALEGRNGRRSRRRPNPARYRKLESNLEEAIASSAPHTAASSVVY